MEYQSVNGSFAPMSVKTLSFTMAQFLYIGLSVKTHWKSAAFRREARTPILRITRGIRFFQHPLPAGRFTLLAKSLLNITLRVHRAYRVPYVRHATHLGSIYTPVGISALCCWRSETNNQPTYPFGSGVSTSFHLLYFTKLEMIHISYPYRSLPCPYVD